MINTSEYDPVKTLAEHSLIRLSVGTIVAAFFWAILYVGLGFIEVALIPCVFCFLVSIALIVYNRTENRKILLGSVLPLVFFLPVLVQSQLGGFASSGAIIIWSILAPLGAAMFLSRRWAVIWGLFFILAVVVAALLDSQWKNEGLAISNNLRVFFFSTNIIGVLGVFFFAILSSLGALSRETEMRLETKEKLRESNKLSSLGELSAGIAHELNQPLTYIIAASNVLSKKNDDLKTREMSARISLEALRMADLVSGFTRFVRPRETKIEEVDIFSVLQDVAVLLGSTLIQAGVELKLDEELRAKKVLGSRHLLQQVFINLIQNAKDSIDEKLSHGGEISVGLVDSDDKEQFFQVVVSDNGFPIEETVAQKMFEPFFTTKGPSRGSGLGLSIIFGLMRDMKGRVYFNTGENNRKEFILELQRVTRAKAECG